MIFAYLEPRSDSREGEVFHHPQKYNAPGTRIKARHQPMQVAF